MIAQWLREIIKRKTSSQKSKRVQGRIWPKKQRPKIKKSLINDNKLLYDCVHVSNSYAMKNHDAPNHSHIVSQGSHASPNKPIESSYKTTHRTPSSNLQNRARVSIRREQLDKDVPEVLAKLEVNGVPSCDKEELLF